MALDHFGGHEKEDVLDTSLAHDIKLSAIPSGRTGLVQSLDILINGPFRNILKV